MPGKINFHCTHLDHLDEGWRMKQVDAILRSSDGPHILAGGLNALRWHRLLCRAMGRHRQGSSHSPMLHSPEYYEEIGKPTPKVEVMKYLKGKQYVDAKDFAGRM
ncbi:hypothetical protein PR202_gn00497 [Eleusine coracana subsp. coracana]|uniref:Uncharacterized protein n=1 Tax=Eleusine coracana subsp. coracana TaxID=191504 RepID=A0AAV5FZR0_ELECO|nr:hypothetical protein PR202_gn00497 [Eleusine coracana subsp. coracana]